MVFARSALLSAVLLLLVNHVAVAAPFVLGEQPAFLPVDDAFQLETVRDGKTLLIRWRMPPGYYLYRHRLELPGLLPASLPEGLAKHDEYFGDVLVYYDELTVELMLDDKAGDELMISYQGCADAGLCYPPQKRAISLTTP